MLAVADPSDSAAAQAAAIVLGSEVNVSIASFEDIETILEQRLEEEIPVSGSNEAPSSREDDIESLRDLASGAPVVRAVNDMLEKAVELRASDIHIEPFRTGLVVRMRVDGLLRHVSVTAPALPQAIISRVKIMAGLNIAERRLPQDGAARVQVARSELDLRVAIMPTQHGEVSRYPFAAERNRLACNRKTRIFARRRSQTAQAAGASPRHDNSHGTDR